MALVLAKSCNAVAEHHSNARRVGLSAPMAAGPQIGLLLILSLNMSNIRLKQ
jgi:hypothetical protein